MLDLITLKTAPVPLLAYCGGGKFIENENFGEKDSAIMYWLFQDCGESYNLQWWCNGWVVFYQESYLTKDHKFEHKKDIPSFNFPHHGSSAEWKHVFQTREEAVWNFKLFWVKLHEGENRKALKLLHNSQYGKMTSKDSTYL